MKLYTVQKRSVWNKWKKQGFLKATECEDEFFENAYAWMKSQMHLRLKDYKGEPLVWLWTERPEWYKNWSDIPRKKFVLLTLELDEDEVVFSDFDAWHIILNDSEFDNGEGWERVFDLEWLRKNYLEEHEKQTLQATTGILDISKVIEVKYFTSKKSDG